MDLDKPLDDMITSKKRSNNSNSNSNNNGGANKPRQSRERRDVPYAACLLDQCNRLFYADSISDPLHDRQKTSGYMTLSQVREEGEVEPVMLEEEGDRLPMSLVQEPLLPVSLHVSR